jgi:SNF2 family DNA or RNA helicase
VEEAGHKVLVWCAFTHEVQMICEHLLDDAVRYDGTMSADQRLEALDRFRDPRDPSKVLVATIKSMAYGVTVLVAKTIVYFSNDYSLERRLQSEDRSHRIGQDSRILIVDLVARGTIDVHVLDALRSHYDVAAQVTGDKLREWIQGSKT